MVLVGMGWCLADSGWCWLVLVGVGRLWLELIVLGWICLVVLGVGWLWLVSVWVWVWLVGFGCRATVLLLFVIFGVVWLG